MPRYADVAISQSALSDSWSGAGVNYKIEANNGDLYWVYMNHNVNDVVFVKSTNGGLSWSNPVTIFAGTATHLAVWYDRWSNIAAGLIHCAYSESVTDDTLYRTINTESADALSTQTSIFAGASTAASGHLSITRALGGNVYCKTCIDAGAEGGFFRLPNANVPNGAWDVARTIDEVLASGDQMILVPGFAADNQDIMAIFLDTSASEISRKIYDDSLNSWAEASIATSFTVLAASTAFPNFAAAVDLTNSRILLVGWNATNALNADLLCWTVTEGAITAKTDVVTNSTNNQGLCAIGLDTTTGYWYAFYGGKADGTETWQTAINVYYKVSTDTGTTWGPETKLTETTRGTFTALFGCPRFAKAKNFSPIHLCDVASNGAQQRCSARIIQPRAAYQLGM